MLLRAAYKFRIYPTETQKAALANQFGQVRFVYNRFLTIRKEHFFATGEGLRYSETTRMLTALKRDPDCTWLNEGIAQAQQQALRNLDRAYDNYFTKKNNGTLPVGNGKPRKDGMPKGFPKYHSRPDAQSLTHPQNFRANGSHFYLPKVGWIRTIFHRPSEGTTKSYTVSKTKTGKYFLSVKVEKEIADPQFSGPAVGIDLGLAHFAILSTGEKIEHPRFSRQAERRLKRAHRALSRKKKGSRNREKAKQRLAREYEKVGNRRRDFLHQQTSRLVRQYGYISTENLNVQGMVRNHKLAKSIQDSGWYEFTRQLAYKGEWHGCYTEKVDRFFPSSQLCSVCGYKNDDLRRHHRFWTCPECKTEHDRDVNAAVNILNGTVGATETTSPNGRGNACGVHSSLEGQPRKSLEDSRLCEKSEALPL